MLDLRHTVEGEECEIRIVEPGDDTANVVAEILGWPVTGFDIEGSDRDVYAPDWHLRLVQFGEGRRAYVFRADDHEAAIREILGRASVLVAHGADYDMLGMHRAYGLPLADLYGKTIDTLTVSRVVDPAGNTKVVNNGKLAPTHKLKDRIRQLCDGAFDMDKELDAEFKRLKLRKKIDGFAKIPIDNEIYNRYAGLDPILAVRLLIALKRDYTTAGGELIEYERRISYVLATMRARGMKLDEQYTREQSKVLLSKAKELNASAKEAGWPVDDFAKKADKIELAKYLNHHGVTIPRTGTGNDSFAKPGLLSALSGTDIEPIALQFFEAKEYTKFERDYLQKLIRLAVFDGRLHPEIDSMGAQTGRMSASNPPVQQLPRAGDVRGCCIADDGHILVGADLSQVEPRVAAGLSRDPNLMKLVLSGGHLYKMAATQLYGENYTDDQYQKMKTAFLARLYGGGRNAVAIQTGLSEDVAWDLIQSIDALYPGTRKFARRVGDEPEVLTEIVGRRIAVDPERTYANINYHIQSTARDIFCQGMLRAVNAGLGPYLWLPVHDELILNVPEADADECLRILVGCMETEYKGIPIKAEGQIMGKRWVK